MLQYVTMFTVFIIASVVIIGFFLKRHWLEFDKKISISDILTFLSVTIALTALALTAFNANKNYKATQTQIKITNKQLDDTNKEKKSNQAVKVASWITNLTATTKSPDAIGNTLASEITVQNSSEIPAYKVFIFTLSNRDSPSYKNLKIDSNELAYIETLPPGKINIKVRSSGMAMGGEHESVAMIFTDSKANIWYRDNYGKLTYITQRVLDTILKRSQVPGPYTQFAPLP